MKAIRRYLRISPKKVLLVSDLVRGKGAEAAMNFLQFTPKKSAKPLLELIRSAVANAEQNFKQDKKDLFVNKIIVTEGPTLKRARPVSRGRSHPIKKRTTHITVELGVRTSTTKTESNKEKVMEKKSTQDTKSPAKEMNQAKKATRTTAGHVKKSATKKSE